MERITISVSPRIATQLRREARRRHVTVSALVRERIGDIEDGTSRPARRIIPWAGVGASGNPKLATEMDDELARTWVAALKSETC